MRYNTILEKNWIFSAFRDNQKIYPREKKTTFNWSIHDIFVKNKQKNVSAKLLTIQCFFIFFAPAQ